MGQKLAKTELFAQWRAGALVIADQGLSTGRRIWVHSGTGVDEGGAGANPDAPLATLDDAIALCTDNKGDIIYLMPGHAETLEAAGELADLDKDGIIIQGLGVGADRPTFTLTHADAQITVDGASITLRNIRFASDIADVVQALDVGGDADGLTIENCEFEDGAADVKELLDAIVIANGCDDVTIRNCSFLTATGGTITSAITFEGTSDNTRIIGCYMNGDYATAAIVGSVGAQSRLLIADNWIKVLDGEPGIELHANSLGLISRNHIETTGLGDADTAIVAADCSWFENYAVVSDGKAGEMIGAVESASVEGKVDSVGTQVSTADSKVVSAHVVTDAALSVADSKVVSAHVVTDAALSVADSKVVSAHVVTDAALSVAESKVVSAHVITDSKVESAHVVSDTALSVAESKVVSAHVITDSKLESAHVVSDALLNLPGWRVAVTGLVADNALPNNTQSEVLATATDGDILIEEVILEKDGTLFAGPTNFELTTNNVYGKTGNDDELMANIAAGLAANYILLATAGGVVALTPFVLEDTKIIYIQGSDATGSSAGNIKYTVIGRALAAGATLA